MSKKEFYKKVNDIVNKGIKKSQQKNSLGEDATTSPSNTNNGGNNASTSKKKKKNLNKLQKVAREKMKAAQEAKEALQKARKNLPKGTVKNPYKKTRKLFMAKMDVEEVEEEVMG